MRIESFNQPMKDRGHDNPSHPSFICPLTLNVMVDPVIDRDGNTYERSAIVEWLAKKRTSPVTRNALVKDYLVPNRALRDAIHSRMGPEWSTKAEKELQHQPAPRTVPPMGTPTIATSSDYDGSFLDEESHASDQDEETHAVPTVAERVAAIEQNRTSRSNARRLIFGGNDNIQPSPDESNDEDEESSEEDNAGPPPLMRRVLIQGLVAGEPTHVLLRHMPTNFRNMMEELPGAGNGNGLRNDTRWQRTNATNHQTPTGERRRGDARSGSHEAPTRDGTAFEESNDDTPRSRFAAARARFDRSSSPS